MTPLPYSDPFSRGDDGEGHGRPALAGELERVAWCLVEALPAKIEAAPLREVMVTLGLLLDRLQALRSLGEGAGPVPGAGEEVLDEERARQIMAVLDAARARQGAAPGGGDPG